MNRRDLFETGAGLMLTGFSLRLASSPRASDTRNHASNQRAARDPVLVRSGFTRKPNGTNERSPSQATMFSAEVVRSADSEGRLAVYVFPAGEHQPYRGAPLHVHHAQDEWIYIMAGEFVAEVDGKGMRLKPGDSLLMPMKIPRRWSTAQESHCGAIHLYTPAGLMDTEYSHPLLSLSSSRQMPRVRVGSSQSCVPTSL